jgi:hypothetical protein
MADLETKRRQVAEAQEALKKAISDARANVLTPLEALADDRFLALDPEKVFDVIALLSVKHPALLTLLETQEAHAAIARFRETNGRKVRPARKARRAQKEGGKSTGNPGTPQSSDRAGGDEQNLSGASGN